MTSDGSIDERETQEIEKLKLAFITAKPNIKKKLSNALDTTTTGFKSLKITSSNLASKSSELASSGLGSSMKLASKTGDSAIKKAQSLKGIFSKKTNTKDGVKYKKKKVTAEIENEWYAIALSEIEDEDFEKGLWSRALISSGGDEHKQKVAYIELRVEQLCASYNLDFDD